jgi:hypothetical protein
MPRRNTQAASPQRGHQRLPGYLRAPDQRPRSAFLLPSPHVPPSQNPITRPSTAHHTLHYMRPSSSSFDGLALAFLPTPLSSARLHPTCSPFGSLTFSLTLLALLAAALSLSAPLRVPARHPHDVAARVLLTQPAGKHGCFRLAGWLTLRIPRSPPSRYRARRHSVACLCAETTAVAG